MTVPTLRTALSTGAIVLLAALSACRTSGPGGSAGADAGRAAGNSTRATDGWRSLASLDSWRGYRAQTIPAAWSVQDGMLMKRGVGEDIVTRETFRDFELAFDWMLDAGGNSGVFYRATEEYDKIYWSAPEYALLDDARHPDGKNPLTTASAAHSLYAPPAGVVHPAGEWNATRIVVKGTHVEHWLNGQKVVEFDYGSPDFTARVAKSKFGRWPNFAKADRGVIGLQGDHGGVLSIRGIRIRELK